MAASRFRILSTGILFLVLALLSACSSDTSQSQQGGFAPEVGVVTLMPTRVVLTTELLGKTASFLRAEVRPQVNGILNERLFTEGAEVKKGDVLYVIEPETYRAAYDNAKAAFAKAEANLGVIDIKARRIAGLRRTNAVSVQDDDDTKAALAQAKAELSAMQAQLESARINLERTRITAPIGGHISKSTVTAGVLVSESMPESLATIYQMDPMYVDVTKSANDVMRLRKVLTEKGRMKGDEQETEVVLILDDGSQYKHKGLLQFTDVGVNEATGSVTLRAVFPNPQNVLLPGLFVRAILTEGEYEDAVVVPQRAIVRDNKGNPMVFVVGEDNKIALRPIETGTAVDSGWFVKKGLALGEKVVVEGLQRLRPGMAVRPMPFEASAPAAGQAPGEKTAEKPQAAPQGKAE